MGRDYEEYAEETFSWDGASSAHHNRTDYSAFRAAQQRDRERSKIRYEQRMKTAIRENLEAWRESVGHRWKDADLRDINTAQSDRILRTLDTRKQMCSFFFYGKTGIGKTYHAYALAKEFIRRGFISPAQVMFLRESTMLTYLKTGFEGDKNLNRVMSDRYKFYFFDDVGRGGNATQDQRNALWDTVMDNMYSRDVNFVMTSNFTISGLRDNFSEATIDRLMLETHRRRIEFEGDNYRLKLAKDS